MNRSFVRITCCVVALGVVSCAQQTREECVTTTSSSIVGAWSAHGPSLSVARSQFSQTRLAIHLSSGELLIPGGGTGSGAVAATDVYRNGGFTTAMNLPMARTHGAVIALDSGKALYAGGSGNVGATTIADRFNLGLNDWPFVGFTQVARAAPGAARLPDGKILIAGGGTTSAEIYDPTNSQFTLTGSLAVSRSAPLAAVLTSGKVAIFGGTSGTSAIEVYDATSGAFTSGPASAPGGLSEATAALLPDGKVLYCGGCAAPSSCAGASFAACYIFDGTTVAATGALAQGRGSHNMVALPTNKVLVVGGISNGAPLGTAAEYDPASGQWTNTGGLQTARYEATIGLLPNGQVLLAGGRTSAGTVIASTEIYDPGTPVVCKVRHPDGTWFTVADGASCAAGACQSGVCAPLPGSDAGAASDAAAEASPTPPVPPVDAGSDAPGNTASDAAAEADVPVDAGADVGAVADAGAVVDAAPDGADVSDASTIPDGGSDAAAAADSGAPNGTNCVTTTTKDGCACSTVPSRTTPRGAFAVAAFAALCLARRKRK
jgi:MYXO-CTERM domain-containing protein